MKIGGAEIVVGVMGVIVVVVMVVAVVMVMVVVMVMIVVMVTIASLFEFRLVVMIGVAMVIMIMQQDGAQEVHTEPEQRNRDCLPECDGDGVDHAHHRFVSDQQGHHGEDDGAREGGEFADLAGSEREPVIADMAAGKAVGEGGDGHRCDMGGHVQAVGDEGHRPRPCAAADLGDHHYGGQCDDGPGAPLMGAMLGAQEDVIVSPPFERIRVHHQVPAAANLGDRDRRGQGFHPLPPPRCRHPAAIVLRGSRI